MDKKIIISQKTWKTPNLEEELGKKVQQIYTNLAQGADTETTNLYLSVKE